MFESMFIGSPKRNRLAQTGWEGFFPYYAGYPETFARDLLTSANLPSNALILDPWNGSGTTTYSAARLGLTSVGLDLNPVMIVVARARLLSPSEADSLEPLAEELTRLARPSRSSANDEPLRAWFTDETAARIRAMERSIGTHLLGGRTLTAAGPNLDRISGLAATFYVALFTVCRDLCTPFRSSNPTWLKTATSNNDRLDITRKGLTKRLLAVVRSMANALDCRARQGAIEHGTSEIKLADTGTVALDSETVDFILTSPPYCTRIDYTAATRIELALMAPLLRWKPADISRRMIGSTRVPERLIDISMTWGSRCANFLDELRLHPSKASGGYYFKTHLDYFDKMGRSMERVASVLKPNGRAVLVVQDSYYKEIHNDLPSIIADIGEAHGLKLDRREDFHLRRSMSGINPHTRAYKRAPGAVEAVLCFNKL